MSESFAEREVAPIGEKRLALLIVQSERAFRGSAGKMIERSVDSRNQEQQRGEQDAESFEEAFHESVIQKLS
jgi:hypothetical protein